MQKVMFFILALAALSFKVADEPVLKGNWEYCGGKFNGKLSPGPTEYKQQRRYTKDKFTAYLIEKGQPDLKYESGNYTLTADTCAETQTYCLQSQDMVYLTVRYHYIVRNDTLILNGKLPNGAMVEDYWRKLK